MLLLFIHLINSVFVIFISHDAIAILCIVFKEYSGKCFNCVWMVQCIYSFSQMK